MEQSLLYILSGVIIVLCIIIIALIKKSGKNKSDQEILNKLSSLENADKEIKSGLSAEFERNRRETSAFQNRISDEIRRGADSTAESLSKMTESNYKNLIEIKDNITQSLNTIRESSLAQNEKQSRIIEASIAKMQESNEKKLDQMRSTVDEKLNETLTSRLDSSFKTVSQQLENVYKSLGEMKELSNGVTNNVSTLNRVLTNVKARGTWAEVQLEGILDQTIPNMYLKNFATVEGSQKRVEFAVKIPSSDGKTAYLPIDSKFPMEDYIRLCDAADNADAAALKAARKALEDRVIAEAKEITKYINIPVTTPFAIMYLATEGLYAEIASSRNAVAEKIQKEYNIMIAGPTTVTALLNSLSMGFKAVAINEKANEVRQLLAVTKAQYEKFGTVLEKAGKKIEEAGRTLDDARKRNDIIRKKLKNIDELDADESQKLIGIDDEDSVSD
ncbi:MAG: DNA recombination protein RmuC [Acutalibacteraceae bacterium]